MLSWVGVVRVVLLLILTVIAVSLVVAIARPETGAVEKVVLAGLIAACLGLGAAVRSGAARLQRRTGRR